MRLRPGDGKSINTYNWKKDEIKLYKHACPTPFSNIDIPSYQHYFLWKLGQLSL